MKRLKIFCIIGVLIFLWGCAPNFFLMKSEKINLHKLEPQNIVECKKSVSFKIVLPEYLDTERILYKDEEGFHYFSKNAWICPLSCILETYFMSSFSCFSPEGELLEIVITDFYPFMEKNSVKMTLKGKIISGNQTKEFIFTKVSKVNNFRELIPLYEDIMSQLIREISDFLKL
ncbi:MAG TPA: hypothetical protein ENI03_02305 [Thermodesulfobacterium geofontis]|nr:hypothetical protein [Thermodesulfobacterium geofontis]